VQRRGETCHEPLLGDRPVADLAALVVGNDPHDGAEPLDDLRARWASENADDDSTSSRSSTRDAGGWRAGRRGRSTSLNRTSSSRRGTRTVLVTINSSASGAAATR
jgi:hypothetical protein